MARISKPNLPPPGRSKKRGPVTHRRAMKTKYTCITEIKDRELGRYMAYVNLIGKTFSLGCYRDLSEAIAIRDEANSMKEKGTEHFLAWYDAFKEKRKKEASLLRKIADLPRKDSDGSEIPEPAKRVVRGISRRDNGFIAQIYYNRKTYSIGLYPTYQEAVQARLQAEEHLGEGFPEWLAEFQRRHREAVKLSAGLSTRSMKKSDADSAG